MAYETLLQAINEIGYFALFFALCFGLFGLPVPNEIVVLTGGALAASGYMAPFPAFALTYLGVCSGLTSGYLIGRFAGAQLLQRFNRKRGIQRFLERSEELSRRYGGYAISISLAFPLLRHVTPYAAGLNRMIFHLFATYAYLSALLWTGVYFLLGTFVGEHIREIERLINQFGLIGLPLLAGAAVSYFILQRIKRKRHTHRATPSDTETEQLPSER